MCLKTAQIDYVKLNYQVQLDDILQIYLLTADKAIDKCDATKGVLTTHIQNWLKSAKNTVVDTYLAPDQYRGYTEQEEDVTLDDIITNNRQDSVSTESPIEESMDRKVKIERVQQLAKFFDPVGYARCLLGIKEFVTPSMLMQIELHNQNARSKL